MPEETPVEEPAEVTPDPLARMREDVQRAKVYHDLDEDMDAVEAIAARFVALISEKVLRLNSYMASDIVTDEEKEALKAVALPRTSQVCHIVRTACDAAAAAVAPAPEPEGDDTLPAE